MRRISRQRPRSEQKRLSDTPTSLRPFVTPMIRQSQEPPCKRHSPTPRRYLAALSAGDSSSGRLHDTMCRYSNWFTFPLDTCTIPCYYIPVVCTTGYLSYIIVRGDSPG